MNRLPRLLLSALATAALPTAPAAAQTSNPGVFSIDPSAQGAAGRPPSNLAPLQVTNTTRTSLSIRVFPALMSQNRNGSIIYSDQPRDLFAAARILHVRPRRFELKRGQSRSLAVTWINRPRGKPAVYVAVVIRGTPPAREGAAIQNRFELVELNYLRLPGRHRYPARVESVRGEQAPRKRLRFFTTVRNTGLVAGRTHDAVLRIRDRRRRVVHQQRWRGGIILPKAVVDFPVDVAKVLPAGTYTAEAALRFGTSRKLRRMRSAFRLVGPNELPTVRLRLTGAAASGEIGDERLRVSARIRNTGTANAEPVVKVRVFRVTRGQTALKALAEGTTEVETLRVGAQRSVDVDVRTKLEDGTYQVVTTLSAPGAREQEFISTFRPKERESVTRRLRTWVSANSTSVALGLVALVLLLVVVGGIYVARLKARAGGRAAPDPQVHVARAETVAEALPTEEAPAATPEATAPAAPTTTTTAPAAPAPTGAIDLNSATVDDLVGVGGLGRRAAERIVAYREANGPFDSVEDVGKVEGFHAERVRRLAEHVRV